MKLSLRPAVRKWIEQRVNSGQYATAEDVIHAAIAQLDQQQRFGDFAPGELNRLIEEGERSIKLEGTADAEELFAEIRRRSAQRRGLKRRSKSA